MLTCFEIPANHMLQRCIAPPETTVLVAGHRRGSAAARGGPDPGTVGFSAAGHALEALRCLRSCLLACLTEIGRGAGNRWNGGVLWWGRQNMEGLLVMVMGGCLFFRIS